MKKALIFILTAVFCFSNFTLFSFCENEVYVSAQCAALMCVQTGELLFAKNENMRHSMASTTKIMTSLLAVEENTPNRTVKVKKEMITVEGTSMGLLEGDTVSLEALVYGMLLCSGNDAANVTACLISESTEKFSDRMNERAKEIGMKNTHFVTPSGLDDEMHYSTAYDMALLGCEAVRNPSFLNICSQKSKTLSYGNPPYKRTLSNHNRLLSSYDGAVGIKTGFTKKSGRCLVSCAQRDGVMLVAVTLGSPDDWNDHERMLDYGFSVLSKKAHLFQSKSILIPVVGSQIKSVKALCAEETVHVLNPDKIQTKIFYEKFLYAPVQKNEKAGEMRIYYCGRLIKTVPLLVSENITALKPEIKSKNIFKRIKDFFKEKTND